MDRRHPLRMLGVTAATAGLCPGQLAANQNPSITYMALTARAVDHAVDLMNRGEL